MIGKKYSHLKL